MRMFGVFAVLPIAGLTWWGVGSVVSPAGPGTIDTFQAVRKTFRVTLQEKGELQASESIDIRSEVGGRATIISLVAEGSSVKKGDLLVELASDSIEERVRSEQIQVASAKATSESAVRQLEILKDQNASNIRKAALSLKLKELELEKYTEGVWQQQEEDAELLIAEAEKIHERAQNDFEYSKTLYEKEFITKSEYDADDFDCYKAKVRLGKAKRDLEILRNYTHVADLQQKESDVDEAQKELVRIQKEAESKLKERESALVARQAELGLKEQKLRRLEDQMSKTKIYAPADGLVVYGAGGGGRHFMTGNQIKEGAEVFERQTILRLPDTSSMKVVVRIHEAQTDKIRLGQEVIIEVEGISHRKFTGKITKIAVLADSQNRWLNPELKEYETEITLNESDPLLKPGVTARAEILIAELDDVVAVPVPSVFTKGHRNFVFVGRRDNAEPVEVQLGLASDEFVEIKSGLEPGTRVLLAVSDLLKAELPEIEESEGSAFEGRGAAAGAASHKGTEPHGQAKPGSGGVKRKGGYRAGGGGQPGGKRG